MEEVDSKTVVETLPFESGSIKVEVNQDADEDSCHYSQPTNSNSLVPQSHIHLAALKTSLQDKGSLLSQTWGELNDLLGHYQAELFNKESEILASKMKYEGITDLEQLKNDLIEKENENSALKERLNSIESSNQMIQMDLSVKESLLKKYQQDLLDKEASLLTLQSANKKLESRIYVLEAKLSTRPGEYGRGSLIGRSGGDGRLGTGLLRHTPAGFKRKYQSSSSQVNCHDQYFALFILCP